jgi:catalase-peroxidase
MAWHSAGTYRMGDGRGGANGGRIRSETQKCWEVNETNELKKVLDTYDEVFDKSNTDKAVAEVYGSDNAKEKFVKDFITSWNKVMNADRFDLK